MAASSPLTVPGLGALSGMVKTMGSGVGRVFTAGLEGDMVESLGKRM